MKYNKTNLKRLINRANKLGIDISNIMKGKDISQIIGRGIESTIKQIKRAIERPKIIKESLEIDKRRKERLNKRKAEYNELLKLKNDIFLDRNPQFRPVFKYDKKHNQSGDAEITAKSYMKTQKSHLINEIFEQFDDVRPQLKKQLTDIINSVGLNIDKLRDMESISQNLIYKQDTDVAGELVELIMDEFGEDVGTHDNFIERLIVRFKSLK